MRLICGFVRLDGAPADGAMLQAMIQAMIASGLSPAIATKAEGPAAFAVLDFEKPVTAVPVAADGAWLAGDIRLDRRPALASKLNLPGDVTTDALAFAALDKFGADFPDKVDGDYAVARWVPTRKELLLARDFMAVRPICYTYLPGKLFAFASLPKGLHSSGVVERRADMTGIAYLSRRATDRGRQTCYQDIHWLEAGYSLKLDADGFRLHRAYHPKPAEVGTWRGTAEEAADIMRELLEDAVASRLPPEGPVAAHLSGGLDSSGLVVLAARQLRAQGRRLHTFSQLPNPRPGVQWEDEGDFVQSVVTQEKDLIWSHEALPEEELDLVDLDIPNLSKTSVPDLRFCAAAQAAGAHILISGAGGDETATFNGSVYAGLFIRGRWRHMWKELKIRGLREGMPAWRLAIHRCLGPLFPLWLHNLRFRLIGKPQITRGGGRYAYLQPVWRRRMRKIDSDLPGRRHSARDRIWMLTHSYVLGRAQRWSIMAARFGLAFTYPLVDRRIVDFTLSLPLERFLSDGYARQPFRDAMKGALPELVRTRESKHSAYPDTPFLLQKEKSSLLARARVLRADERLKQVFNIDLVIANLKDLPDDQAAAEKAARSYNRIGMPPDPKFRGAEHAARMIDLMEFILHHA